MGSGQIHFTCVNEAHRGQEAAIVTVREQLWAYCEGTPSATEHEWVRLDAAVGVAELELARLVRRRARASAGVPASPASKPFASRPDTRGRSRVRS